MYRVPIFMWAQMWGVKIQDSRFRNERAIISAKPDLLFAIPYIALSIEGARSCVAGCSNRLRNKKSASRDAEALDASDVVHTP